MRAKILNLEPENYSSVAKEMLEEHFDVTEQEMSRTDLIKNLKNYDILITRLGHQIDQELLLNAPTLKAIVTATTGLNHIDTKAAQQQNCEVLCLKGETEFLNSICATAEHTVGLLLSLIRHIPQSFTHVHDGSWDRNQFKSSEIHNKTVGILGYGRLGKLVAKYLTAFGADIIAHDIDERETNVNYVTYNELLEKSDIISVHLAYTPETRHMINRKSFEIMKPGTILINTARGEVIDEQALLNALTSEKLSGAAIDVLQGEYSGSSDWQKNDPLIQYAKENGNLLITPHIGGATYESMEKTEIFMAQKLIKFMSIQ